MDAIIGMMQDDLPMMRILDRRWAGMSAILKPIFVPPIPLNPPEGHERLPLMVEPDAWYLLLPEEISWIAVALMGRNTRFHSSCFLC